MTLTWNIKTFAELTKAELYEVLHVRQDVFIVEQACAYNDIDGDDSEWLHIFAQHDERIVAYARLRLQNDKQNTMARIGRVLVVMPARNKGLARELMQRSIAYIHEAEPNCVIELSAQCYLLDFYRTFGFSEVGYEYLEDNIPHHDMEWRA